MKPINQVFQHGVVSALAVSVLFLHAPHANAQTVPSYPSCVNPQGDLKVSYDEGTHGIVGSLGTHTGSDTVYSLGGDAYVQCFCPDDGDGIQTDWLNVSEYGEGEIQALRNQGWFYVPNGALWGLSQAPFMAKNTIYTCNTSGTGGGSNDSSDNNSTSDSNGIGGGEILSEAASTVGDILGLANTGNIMTVYALVALGIISFVMSVVARKRKTYSKTEDSMTV